MHNADHVKHAFIKKNTHALYIISLRATYNMIPWNTINWNFSTSTMNLWVLSLIPLQQHSAVTTILHCQGRGGGDWGGGVHCLQILSLIYAKSWQLGLCKQVFHWLIDNWECNLFPLVWAEYIDSSGKTSLLTSSCDFSWATVYNTHGESVLLPPS